MKYKNPGIIQGMAPWLNLAVFVCLALAVIAALSGIAVPYLAFVVQVLLGGFIGGITNNIAITMLFEEKWYLPGSGVLLKRHKDIIRSLASTVEKHLVNSEMLQAEIKKLLKPINTGKAGQIMNNVIDEFRGDIRRYLKSRKVHDDIKTALKTRLGFLGKFLNITRIREYDEMTDAIIGELLQRIDGLRVTKEMILRTIQRVGTLEDFLFRPNNELVQRHYHTDRSLAQMFFDNLDIQSMVSEKLATYPPSKVRDIIEENIRAHLLWLEVFGVLLGMLFAGVVYFVMHALEIPM